MQVCVFFLSVCPALLVLLVLLVKTRALTVTAKEMIHFFMTIFFVCLFVCLFEFSMSVLLLLT